MSTHVTLRPSRTDWWQQIGLHGGTSFFGILSDQSDSTYVQANANEQSLIVGFAGPSLASNQRVNGVTIWSRSARDTGSGGGYTQDVTLKLFRNTQYNTAAATYTIQRGSTIIYSLHGPQAHTPPHSTREWTAADLSVIDLQITWHRVHTGTDAWAKIFDAWLDVEIITAATIDTPVVSNFTNNASPSVTWNFTDPDAGRQQAYRVRVFDAATIAMHGFDPAKSRAVWDSGVAINQATASTVVGPLLNGTTYTAYVNAAKNGPTLPLGTPYWWTGWAASAPFTVTFVPPATPAIQSAAVLADETMYRGIFSILAPVNLLSLDNASFENTVGTWSPAATGTVLTRDTTQASNGVASMKITSSGSQTSLGATAALDSLGGPYVTSEQTYNLQARFRANTTGRQCQIGVTWVAHDGVTQLTTNYSTVITDTSTGWTLAQLQVTPPLNAERAIVRLLITPTSGSIPSGEIHWIDQVDIHAGSGTGWGPGGYANSITGLVLQRAELIDDARGNARNWFQESVASAASVMQDPTYGFQWDITNAQVVWQWLDKKLGVPGTTPPGMLRWTPYVVNQKISAGTQLFADDIDCMVPAVPGQTYAFSCWAWTNTGAPSVNAGIEWRDANGGILSTSAGSNVALTTTPQRIMVTSPAPTGAVFCTGRILNPADPSIHVYLTRFGLGVGTDPVDGLPAMGKPLEWRPVNFSGNADVLTAQPDPLGMLTGQVETLPDFEYVPGLPLVYRAQVGYVALGNVLVSPWSNYVALYSPPPTKTIMRSFIDPTLSVVANRRQGMSLQISEDSQIFHPLSANGATVRIRDWVSGEDGSIDLVTHSDSQAMRLRRLLIAGDVVEILWAQGGRTYAMITGSQIAETTNNALKICDVDGSPVGGLRYAVTTITYLETVWPGTLTVNALGEFLLSGGVIDNPGGSSYVVYSLDGTSGQLQTQISVTDFSGTSTNQPFNVQGF